MLMFERAHLASGAEKYIFVFQIGVHTSSKEYLRSTTHRDSGSSCSSLRLILFNFTSSVFSGAL